MLAWCLLAGMARLVWWDQELLLFPDQEVLALMPGIHTLSFSLKESAWKALDRVMALLWSGAGEGAKGRGFSFGFGSVNSVTIVSVVLFK